MSFETAQAIINRVEQLQALHKEKEIFIKANKETLKNLFKEIVNSTPPQKDGTITVDFNFGIIVSSNTEINTIKIFINDSILDSIKLKINE